MNRSASFYPYLYLYKGLNIRLLISIKDYNKHVQGEVIEINKDYIKINIENKTYTLSKTKLEEKEIIQYPIIPEQFISIHKSQGLEFNNVIVIVDNLFEINHFYTAISRSRENLKLITLNNSYNIKDLNNVVTIF